MENIKRIYNKICIALKRQYIFSWQQFKDRKDKKLEHKEYLRAIGDWYYQHSWFERKWFLHKLKRIIMKLIYNLFEKGLETYFVEIGFFTPPSNKLEKYNKKHGTEFCGDFKMYLPLLVRVKNRSQAEQIANKIFKTLSSEYNIENIFLFNVGEKPLSKDSINDVIEYINRTYCDASKTRLEINTYTPNYLQEYDFENPIITNVDIPVISVGSINWIGQHEYIVKIFKTTMEK